jgi:hypothetical protein
MDDRHYIKGFEDGCEFICAEIEKWGKQHNLYVADVLHHLRGKDDEKSAVHDKKGRPDRDLLRAED